MNAVYCKKIIGMLFRGLPRSLKVQHRIDLLHATRPRRQRVEVLNSLVEPDRSEEIGMGKKSFYAVVRGRQPGVYTTWPECRDQVHAFGDSKFKGFGSEREALSYLQQHGVHLNNHISMAERGDGHGAHEKASRQGSQADPMASRRKRPKLEHGEGRAEDDTREENRREPNSLVVGHDFASEKGFGDEDWARPERGDVVRVEFDGASKGNPGPSGFGAVLYDGTSNREVGRLWKYLSDNSTNNQAEYMGLIAGLQLALKLGYDTVEVQGDSKLVVHQVLGDWKVKNQGLAPYNRFAVKLKDRFRHFKARQVPRAMNSVADALSNQAIDARREEGSEGASCWSLIDAEREFEQGIEEGKRV